MENGISSGIDSLVSRRQLPLLLKTRRLYWILGSLFDKKMWFEALSSGWAEPKLSLYKRSWAFRELSDSTHGGLVRCLFSFTGLFISFPESVIMVEDRRPLGLILLGMVFNEIFGKNQIPILKFQFFQSVLNFDNYALFRFFFSSILLSSINIQLSNFFILLNLTKNITLSIFNYPLFKAPTSDSVF